MILDSIRIFSLSEYAIVVDFGNRIDAKLNAEVLALSDLIQINPFPGFIELVPAYSSLTLFYDFVVVKKAYPAFSSVYKAVENLLIDYLISNRKTSATKPPRSIQIPVCYSETFGWDWKEVSQHTGLSRNDVIYKHTSNTYQVYMMGFLPGFAYLGGMDDHIAVPRKLQPRLKVESGSVGIAGTQTGIYPLDSPGGWQIIGKTPVKLFNPYVPNPVFLQAGDQIQFYEIDEQQFYCWK